MCKAARYLLVVNIVLHSHNRKSHFVLLTKVVGNTVAGSVTCIYRSRFQAAPLDEAASIQHCCF